MNKNEAERRKALNSYKSNVSRVFKSVLILAPFLLVLTYLMASANFPAWSAFLVNISFGVIFGLIIYLFLTKRANGKLEKELESTKNVDPWAKK